MMFSQHLKQNQKMQHTLGVDGGGGGDGDGDGGGGGGGGGGGVTGGVSLHGEGSPFDPTSLSNLPM